MQSIGLLNSTASADVLASTVKGRLHRLYVSLTPEVDQKSVAVVVRQTAGGDTGAIVASAGFARIPNIGTVVDSSGLDPMTKVFDFGPDGVPFTAGLRLTVTQGATGTNNAKVNTTALYVESSGA